MSVQAHPRVCGENDSWVFCILEMMGSSPRVRGKQAEKLTHLQKRRLIPACAGKTSSEPSSQLCVWAHPRVCGENTDTKVRAIVGDGSSPRVRGKLPAYDQAQITSGLIPACAGKTSRHREVFPHRRAHPRVCGENLPLHRPASRQQGSSPRVRGKRDVRLAKARIIGLIPACAGKTLSLDVYNYTRGAHPRVCGENEKPDCEKIAAFGSSPRVRGKQPAPGN